MVKVKEINLERGFPTVDMAIRDMVGKLGTYKRQGYRALILIHGYGSTGVGGSIKVAVRTKLKESSLSGLVKTYVGGEDWINRKKECVEFCSQLRDFESRIYGNNGVTVVLLK
ncbi:Smr/MutS family protein [Anaerovorax sp. IOR16]|uniref:Smr/MutS family protein n=1 Tax=Anaerovorax sp. IOR16 TaxID=2773458 RepID=UPI0019D1FD3F|nr:Smr/MutS family protein [Anaerovorax sp. IOR16]